MDDVAIEPPTSSGGTRGRVGEIAVETVLDGVAQVLSDLAALRRSA